MAIHSREEYEQMVYALPLESEEVVSSSLHVYPKSRFTAVVRGTIHFKSGLELRVKEFVDFALGRITDYGYTVFLGNDRVRWYDPQPHPEVPELQITFPHHRHEPPDTKHNRKPAPGISFTSPNLATLITDCIELGATITRPGVDETDVSQSSPAQ